MRKWFAAVGFIACLSGYADTTFVNLSDKGVRVARYFYTDGNDGKYNEQGWVFKGWTVVEPGGLMTSDSNYFYVEYRHNERAVVWNELETSRGYIKRGGPFEDFLARGASDQRLMNRGFTQVRFMKFRDEVYTIGGNAYRLSTKDIPFDYESRSLQFLNETIQVPGRVVSADIDGVERGGKNLKWTNGERSIRLTGSIEGRQTSPFAAREKGFYRGTIHVKYIARQ